MGDFWAFRKMITPVIIQVIFWIAVLVCVVMGIVTMTRGGIAVFGGLLIWILGPLFARIYCELLIVIFRIHENLTEIRRNTEQKPQ